MPLLSKFAQRIRPALNDYPKVLNFLRGANYSMIRARHGAARFVPSLIQPTPESLFISITGSCNFRCIGCRYERDFMVGQQLDLAKTIEVMEDAKEAGVSSVRLYGGEPLLHPDLPEMIRKGTELGLEMYVTTNGSLLDKKIDELHAAGLRWLTIGFYGGEGVFDKYTQREALVGRVERSLERVRERYGPEDLEIQLNFVVVKPLATLDTLEFAWSLVEKYQLFMHFDLYGYSIPFFTSGPNDELAFLPEDLPELDAVVDRILVLQKEHPDRFPHSRPFLRSIPDWVTKKENMRIPCDAYRFLWVGPDGSVQLCDTAFPLGNVNETRLKDIVFGSAHKEAARGAYQLSCPNCTCQVEDRIRKHGPSWRRYKKQLKAEEVGQ